MGGIYYNNPKCLFPTNTRSKVEGENITKLGTRGGFSVLVTLSWAWFLGW